MRLIEVEIKGIAPLLHHKYTLKGEVDAPKRSGKPDYSQEWLEALYWSDEIGVYQPASHIEGAMIKAAVNFQIPGRGKKTYKDIVKSAVFTRPDYIPFGMTGNPEKLQQEGKFDLDCRAVIVNRGRVERIRPIFRDWGLKFQLEICDDQISDAALKDILDHAGKYCGIGDYRPRFGRFMTVEFRAN